MNPAPQFDTRYGEQPILAGYVGALLFVVAAFLLSLWGKSYLLALGLDRKDQLLLIIMVVFFFMLGAEYAGRRRYQKRGFLSSHDHQTPPSQLHLLKSTLFRFAALFAMFSVMYLLIQNHYYFDRHTGFQITRRFFDYLLYLYLIGGIPYIYLTLYFRWGREYEYNDYGILLLILFKHLFRLKPHWKRLSNRRIRKVLLTYLVTLFFLTLMVRFFENEYNAFESAFKVVSSDSYTQMRFYMQHHHLYQMLYHLLFVIDVGIAIIGYTVSSRWLHNRVRSVDMTLGGWMVAIMCYPPMNSGFTDQFIGYGNISHTSLGLGENALMILKTLILFLFSIYVWATMALGFKFSNLTHRGIVTTGPYRFIRHPAYACKNMAWWLDATFVLTNLWAALALAIWNVIYILRGLTEERHLKKDPKYAAYCKAVPYRFIYKIV